MCKQEGGKKREAKPSYSLLWRDKHKQDQTSTNKGEGWHTQIAFHKKQEQEKAHFVSHVSSYQWPSCSKGYIELNIPSFT